MHGEDGKMADGIDQGKGSKGKGNGNKGKKGGKGIKKK